MGKKEKDTTGTDQSAFFLQYIKQYDGVKPHG